MIIRFNHEKKLSALIILFLVIISFLNLSIARADFCKIAAEAVDSR